jgi:nucleoid DNA-binding protein
MNIRLRTLALDEINTLVGRELKKEGSIRLPGLGIFRKRKLAARQAQSRHRRTDLFLSYGFDPGSPRWC